MKNVQNFIATATLLKQTLKRKRTFKIVDVPPMDGIDKFWKNIWRNEKNIQ